MLWTAIVSVWRLADGLDRASRTGPIPVAATRIDVNRATVAELRLLPGFGPVRARSVVLERLRGGHFRTSSDLLRVPGIGPATVAGIDGWIRVGP